MSKEGAAVYVYREWWQVARRIRSDAARARYLMAILDYAFDGTEPDDEQLDILTLTARMQIDQQRAAFAERSAKARASVATRYERIRTYTNEYERREQEQEQEQEYKEKITPNGVTKKKAQQAAQGAGGSELSSNVKKLSLDANFQEEKEKSSAQKEKEPPLVAVEVVTSRTRAQPAQRFVPPTVEEVAEYCRQRQNGIDAEEFVAAYQQSGWRLKGGSPMKDWKSAVITWEKYRKRNISNGNTRNYDNDKSVRDAEFARYWAGRIGNQPV